MISRFSLRQAHSVYRAGGVLAYPTESVFGLGCDPLNATAVQQILTLKQRPEHKGLILIASRLEQLLPFIRIDQAQQNKLLKVTPTPTTWLVNSSLITPRWITGQHLKLAVRLTQHPIAHALCEALDGPLVSTSANPSKRPAAKTKLQLRQYFHNMIDFIVPGEVGGIARPSQIRDLESNLLIRPG